MPPKQKSEKQLEKEKFPHGKPCAGEISLDKEGNRNLDAKRSCCAGCDCICTILFVAGWIALFVIGAIAWKNGDPKKLYKPYDSMSRMCGYSAGVENAPYLYFPELIHLSMNNSWCVSACPNFTESEVGTYCICYNSSELHTCGPSDLLDENCYIAYPARRAYYSFARCIPSMLSLENTTALMAPYTNIIVRGVQDVASTWWVFLVAAGLSIVLCFIWLCFLRYYAACMVYTAILLVLTVIAAAAAYVLWYGVGEYREAQAAGGSTTSPIIILVIGGCLALGWVILLLIICVMCSRIRLAVAIVKVACRALTSMPCIIVTPLITIALMGGFAALCLSVWIYLVSSGDFVTIVDGSRSFNFNWTLRYLTIYLIFFFFWGIFFLYGMTQMVISGAVHIWYWARKDKDDNIIKRSTHVPICASFRRAFRYHIGGVAFGSLIIAIIATVRVILLYIQKKLKQTKNKALQYCLSCVSCCLACLQKIVEKITKTAYIIMALNGTGFCRSAFDGFNLLMRNILRVAAISGVGEFLIFTGKLVVSVICAVVALLIIRPGWVNIDRTFVSDVTYWWLPVIIIFVLCFFMASAFFTIYGFTMDTLFVDFVEDEERTRNTSAGAYTPFAPTVMRDCMTKVSAHMREEREMQKRQLEEEEAKLAQLEGRSPVEPMQVQMNVQMPPPMPIQVSPAGGINPVVAQAHY